MKSSLLIEDYKIGEINHYTFVKQISYGFKKNSTYIFEIFYFHNYFILYSLDTH